MGINFSVIDNSFQFRDIYKCIQDSKSIDEALKTIFYESCNFRIEDYFDTAQTLKCTYKTKTSDFKIFLTCNTCKVGPLCPFCYTMGGHRKHKTQKDLFNYRECICRSSNFQNSCAKHSNNNSGGVNFNASTFKEVKKEVHLFFRYILSYMLENPSRPRNKTNNQTFSMYWEILQFLQHCVENSKFLAGILTQELLSCNIDIDGGKDDVSVSLVDLVQENQFKKDIRYTVPIESIKVYNDKDFIPPLANSAVGYQFIKHTTYYNNKREVKSFNTEKDKLNLACAGGSNVVQPSVLINGASYLNRMFNGGNGNPEGFSNDLKCAHINLLSTLVKRDKTFKILFYRNYFNVFSASFSPNDRFSLYWMDTFYNDRELIRLWVERSNLIKNIILASDGFEHYYRNWSPLRFLPDIVRTNRKAAIYLIKRDFQKLTSHIIEVEDKTIARSTKMSHVRIKSRYFAQNTLFLYLYLFRQDVPIDLQQYFTHYVESLVNWKQNLSTENENQHFDLYDGFPMLLAATAIENETNYEKLKITTWANVCKYSFLLSRSFILSQTSFLTVCKRKPTSQLAMFPVVNVEVTSTVNTLQILMLINFKELLSSLLKKTTILFDVEEILFSSYSNSGSAGGLGSLPTHLIYRFIINILQCDFKYKVSDQDAIYHFTNLVHRGIDVPLDLGKSNSIFRNYHSSDVERILNLISTAVVNSSSKSNGINGNGIEDQLPYDFLPDNSEGDNSGKMFKSLSSNIGSGNEEGLVQTSTMLSDTMYRVPNHCSRKLNPEYNKYIDNYYWYTNIYHIEYYGHPTGRNSADYPLQDNKQYYGSDRKLSPPMPLIFKYHKNLFFTQVLGEQLLYNIIFRDLVYSLFTNSKVTTGIYDIYDVPSIIVNVGGGNRSMNTSSSIKSKIALDLIALVSTLLSYGQEYQPESSTDKLKLDTDINEYFKLTSKSTISFKPTYKSPLTLLLSSQYRVDLPNTNGGSNVSYHSILTCLLAAYEKPDCDSIISSEIERLLNCFIKIDTRFTFLKSNKRK